MILPALSVKQPWATKIANGSKTIETRTWYTPWRGPLLIVSSKTPDLELENQATGLPLGQALCVTLLVNCRPMIEADEQAACCECYERANAWVFKGLWPIIPFAVRGRKFLYTLSVPPQVFPDETVAEEVTNYLARALAKGFRLR
jgi:hypothetical protein